MTVGKLDKAQWHSFFDIVSRLLNAHVAEVEVAVLDLGDQTEAEWLALIGITHDPHDDIVEIALDGIDHPIRNPREIYIDGEAAGLSSLEIVDGTRHIMKLKDRLMLEPPAAAQPRNQARR